MRAKRIIVTVIALLVVTFTAFNWDTLTTYLPVNFLFFDVLIPLGLLLVGAIILGSLLFLLLSRF